MRTPIDQLKREAIAEREVLTVHTWRLIVHRYLCARDFDTSAEAWAWVHEQIEAGKDMGRVRVTASNSIQERAA